jgi:hypothetical protein
MRQLLVLSSLLTGCFGVAGGRNSVFLGGGGIGLFLLIFVAALLFGKRH